MLKNFHILLFKIKKLVVLYGSATKLKIHQSISGYKIYIQNIESKYLKDFNVQYNIKLQRIQFKKI